MKFKKIIIALFVVALFFAGIAGVKRVFPLKYEDVIDHYANKYNLSEELLLGVICAESKFDTMAHSGKAMGLMQITDDTAKWICDQLSMEYSEDMLYVPETNIKMGSYYLSHLMDLYHNTETALAAYNAGMGNVNKWLGDERYSTDGVTLSDIPYGETKRYVQRVKKLGKIYEFIY